MSAESLIKENTETKLEEKFILNFYEKYKGRSWADICDELEEEEELQAKIQQKAKLDKEMAKRRELFNNGEYELEEGEVLE